MDRVETRDEDRGPRKGNEKWLEELVHEIDEQRSQPVEDQLGDSFPLVLNQHVVRVSRDCCVPDRQVETRAARFAMSRVDGISAQRQYGRKTKLCKYLQQRRIIRVRGQQSALGFVKLNLLERRTGRRGRTPSASRASRVRMQTLRVEVPGEGYHANLIACQRACPVHTDARGYVRAIAEGRFEEAYLIKMASYNPWLVLPSK